MLKIEVIKFEAQDVITSSVAAPVEPEIKEDPKCACDGNCTYSAISKRHYNGYPSGNNQCYGIDGTGVHTCGKE